nr:hypothetical protein [Tanacetum cinerariifolium]
MTEKIVQIKNRLLTARSRQKSYADRRTKLLEFEVGDMVLLKVSPWKGAKCLAKGDIVVSMNEIKLDDKLHVIEEPVETVDEKPYASALISPFEDPNKILEQDVTIINDDLMSMRQATAQSKYKVAEQASAKEGSEGLLEWAKEKAKKGAKPTSVPPATPDVAPALAPAYDI